MGWSNSILKFGRARRQVKAQAGVDQTSSFDPRVASGRGMAVDTISGNRVDPQIAEEIKLRQKQLMLRYVMTIRAR